jgi:high-affinity K+ transport system ATPase subunit B
MAKHQAVNPSLFDLSITGQAAKDAFVKLKPRLLARNPVIFVTAVVSALVTALWLRDLFTANGSALFSGQIAAWLWFTVLFANFAEAVAEGRVRRKPTHCAAPAPTQWRAGCCSPMNAMICSRRYRHSTWP